MKINNQTNFKLKRLEFQMIESLPCMSQEHSNVSNSFLGRCKDVLPWQLLGNTKLLTLILVIFCIKVKGQEIQQSTFKPKHEYSQSLVMKVMNATVNKDGSSFVYADFENTLSLIKKVDKITLGVPKILYLTGWQYNGHDDKYPAFFEVNSALKRPQDKTALQSLKWLFKEAKKYHTTISLHINMTDAYENSPLWKEYVEKNMISKNADGSLKKIGFYNNLNTYQINYKHEWENGYAQMRVDKLLNMLPELKESGTIHLDAWIARNSEADGETAITERSYQSKLCDYWNSKGIDVTTEMVLDYMIGKVPFVYHFYKRNQNDYLNVPASVFTGTDFNPDVPSDEGLKFLFGISMTAEMMFPGEWGANFHDRWFLPTDKAILPKGNWKDLKTEHWTKIFINEFYLNCPQYFFLNKFRRLKVDGIENNRTAYFANDISVSLADSTVNYNGKILRKKDLIFFPAEWLKNNSYVLYSPFPTKVSLDVPDNWKSHKKIKVQEVTETGLLRKKDILINANKIMLTIEGNKPLVLNPI